MYLPSITCSFHDFSTDSLWHYLHCHCSRKVFTVCHFLQQLYFVLVLKPIHSSFCGKEEKKVILPWVFLLPHKLNHGHVVLCTVFLFYFHFQFIVLKRTNKHVFCPFLFPELNKNPVEGFSAGLIDDDDIYKWEVVIIGPQDTLL